MKLISLLTPIKQRQPPECSLTVAVFVSFNIFYQYIYYLLNSLTKDMEVACFKEIMLIA